MSYLVVENFSAGLDTRRHPLTAKAGTLQKLDNAHISRGGEIEKRKAFVELATVAGDTFLFPHGTFGLEATADKIYVFCSHWNASYAYKELHIAVDSGLPIWVMRLDHPDMLQMTEVVYSTLYGGKTFVIAKYSDGSIYPFYDGVIISDFVNGIVRPSEVTYGIPIFASHLAATVGDGYSAYVTGGNTIVVTGQPGVEWTPSATVGINPSYPDLPPHLAVAVTTTIPSKVAVAEVLASGAFSITGGAEQPASFWKDGRNMDGAGCPGIRSIRVGASTLSTADGLDLIAWGGTIGLKYLTYAPTYTTGSNWGNLLYNIAKAINDNTSSGLAHGYSAYSYRRAQNSGNDTNSMYFYAPAAKGADGNNIVVQIEFDADPSGIYEISSLVDPATIAPSPYNTGKFIATMGVTAGGVTNAITSVTVDGVESMGDPIPWVKSNTDTSLAVAAKINSFTGAVDYSASVSSGEVVLTASAGTGKSPNGKHITITTVGNVVVSGVKTFSGGLDGISAVSQVSRFTITGTLFPGETVTLVATPKLDASNPIYWGATRIANSTPLAALTFKSKEHIISGSSLFFSGVNQPTSWGLMGVGSGFINMSNNFGGNEVLTGLALYQGYLAAFARRSVQVWKMDPDPALNAQGQVINNTGSIAKKSIVSVGEIDVFYLSDSGVRSLRARDASNAAMVNDVGTPIDSLVLSDLSAMTEDQKSKCCAIIEPIDGRYWLAVGDKIYVYSYFPSGQVSAWSTYHPGFSVSKFTTKDGLIYARAGNNIYVYGGTNGTTYDSSAVELILPYLDGGKPSHQKTFNGIDLTVQGEWSLYAGMDPLAPSARELVATVDKPTFSLDRVAASGMGTHLGLRFTNQSPGYARLANIIAHFELNDAS